MRAGLALAATTLAGAPDGQAYLFVFRIGGLKASKFHEIVCFVRPKGGL